jgi:hypothetical protein
VPRFWETASRRGAGQVFKAPCTRGHGPRSLSKGRVGGTELFTLRRYVNHRQFRDLIGLWGPQYWTEKDVETNPNEVYTKWQARRDFFTVRREHAPHARHIREGGSHPPATKCGGTLIKDLDTTIAELREEFERIRIALAALERLAAGGKRRGRPPKWLASVRNPAVSAPASKKRAAKAPAPKAPPSES